MLKFKFRTCFILLIKVPFDYILLSTIEFNLFCKNFTENPYTNIHCSSKFQRKKQFCDIKYSEVPDILREKNTYST